MVKAPAKKAAPKATSTVEPKAVSPQNDVLALFKTLNALEAAHGVLLETPAADQLAPGQIVMLRTASPISIERFVAEAQERLQVRGVRVLATHIELDVVVPAAGDGQ